MKKILFVILGLILLARISVVGEEFIWEFKQGDSVVFLMGAIHLLRTSDHPFAQVYQTVIEQADRVVLETDWSDQKAADQAYERFALYSRDTVHNHLTEETKQLLFDYQVNTRFILPVQLKPMPLADTIFYREAARQGFLNEQGVDSTIFNMAEALGKPLTALETPTELFKLVYAHPDEVGDRYLKEALLSVDAIGPGMEKNIQWWADGDADQMGADVDQEIASNPTIYDRVYTLRNRNWLPKIRQYLTEPQVTLICVGAGHIVGKEGLLALLGEEGFHPVQLPLPLPARLIPKFGKVEVNGHIGKRYELQRAGDPSGPWTAATMLDLNKGSSLEWENPDNRSREFFRAIQRD